MSHLSPTTLTQAEQRLILRATAKHARERRVQFAWREWQKRAGFDRLYPFHCIRHSSITNVYRATRDLFLAQRVPPSCPLPTPRFG